MSDKISEVIYAKLVEDQFSYGGSKYAGDSTNPQKEATDHLVDDFTYLWLIGTFAKYAKRFKNTSRERDLLKTGCYMYITWLKRGYHIYTSGTSEIIDTNVFIKSQYYTKFLERVQESSVVGTDDITKIYEKFKDIVDRYLDTQVSLEYVSDKKGAIRKETVKELIQKGFNFISESDLIFIYKSCYLIWDKNFKDKQGQDADTWNESKK